MTALNTGDISFLVICTLLVFLMTPGLALFYGGMVRKRNVLSIMMQSYAAMGVVTVIWVLFGYSLAFGPDHGHIIGGLDWIGLRGVGLSPNPDYAPTIPHLLFFLFQLMFAIITPAVISGATAERLRFTAFLLFIILWSTFVYIPLAHWVWGVGGWMRNLGVLDFAGGTVVEVASGVSGLVAAFVVGKRLKVGYEWNIPHHMPNVLFGGGLLWFGWFGFNSGGAMGANGVAVLALATTQIAGATGMIGWALVEWLHRRQITVFGAVSGIISALVAITPAAGYVSTVSALLIGFIAGGVCYLAVSILKAKLGYDDALDVFGIHGIGGTWGTIATGIFADLSLNPQGKNGWINGGGFEPVLIQLLAVLATYIFAGMMTFLILKGIALITPLRASDDEQVNGLDLTQHREKAYPDFELSENVYI
ncbi:MULTISPECIES: ammonium transporter [Desulfosporosinus]|uniref:Ammonium transporter n=1 Tax=Desulfosporosinus nitroreducens TaxID=2018668 RepID=A0ABT8QQD3_9FIRM|nr:MULTISPECIES: ammonium transporter [Desulfosporosinus]MDA8221166.1 ammonium transporter [Desulfitobacterium hafniense]MDO0823554.1 ammonium transporter [Desulfosporosinus nitroreducens]